MAASRLSPEELKKLFDIQVRITEIRGSKDVTVCVKKVCLSCHQKSKKYALEKEAYKDAEVTPSQLASVIEILISGCVPKDWYLSQSCGLLQRTEWLSECDSCTPVPIWD